MTEDEALQVLQDARDALKDDPPENLHDSDDVYERYQQHFRPGQVESLSEEVFSSFLSYENNRHWSNLQRQKSRLTSDMESLREGLSTLVDEERLLAPRFTEATEQVNGMGRAIATAILHVAYPSRYGIWNGTSEGEMDRLDLLPEFESGATIGEKYKEINDVLRFLSEELSVDLWTLDILWARVRGSEISAEESASTENTSGTGSEDSLSGAFEEVLESYLGARRSADHVESSLSVWSLFERIESLFEESPLLGEYPHIRVDWSVGMPGGKMTHTPWIAFLDDRETDTTRSGIYAVYLFRADMSGVYLTYNQGVTRPAELYEQTVGNALIQNRAERIRKRSPGLEEEGFRLDNNKVDLAAETQLAEDYERATTAYKLYEAGKLPSDSNLFSDLEVLLQSYDRYLTQREERQSPEINREKLDMAVENVIRPVVEGRGDLAENGSEHHRHDQVISGATPHLTPDRISARPQREVLGALRADPNLLSDVPDRSSAVEFFESASEDEIKQEVSSLLFGEESLADRVRRFLEWGEARETKEERTGELTGMVASYLLGLSDPQEYAFCKTDPVYRPAVEALLGEGEVRSDWPERIAHARDFYRKALSIFEEEYPDLHFFDLMHVHIAFFIAENAGGEEWGEGPINLKEGSGPEETVRRDVPNVYKVATGEDGTYWDDFREGGFLCVGWDGVGDLRQYDGEQQFREAFYGRYLDSQYDGRKQKAAEKAGELWSLMEMKPGDRIVANEGESRVLGVGTVTEPGYEWRPEREEFRHVVHVDWDTSYEQSIESRGHWRFKTVKQLPHGFIEERLETASEPYSVEEATDGLFYERSDFETWLGRLREKKNLILQGPPGVGKTFVSKRLAHALMGEKDEDRTQMVQLHQSYAYEDFIRGYRPTPDGNFRLKDGVFFQFCEQAKEDSGRGYVFIIDEINRGNLSKVFGELMMLIEPDKRGPDHAVQLSNRREENDPYGNQFYVPENLYLIGMMNTADRSLAMVDYALRRRFAFVEMEPRFHDERFKAHLRERGASEEMIDQVVSRLRSLNGEIAEDDSLGEGFRIGHSYFCPGENEDPDQTWYREVIAREIEPLLKEYWFDASEKAENHISDLKGNGHQ